MSPTTPASPASPASPINSGGKATDSQTESCVVKTEASTCGDGDTSNVVDDNDNNNIQSNDCAEAITCDANATMVGAKCNDNETLDAQGNVKMESIEETRKENGDGIVVETETGIVGVGMSSDIEDKNDDECHPINEETECKEKNEEKKDTNDDNDNDNDDNREKKNEINSPRSENKEEKEQAIEIEVELELEPITAMDTKIRQFQSEIRSAIKRCMQLKYSQAGKSKTKANNQASEEDENDDNETKEDKITFDDLYDILEGLESNYGLPETIKTEIEYLIFKFIQTTMFDQFKIEKEEEINENLGFDFGNCQECIDEVLATKTLTAEIMRQVANLVFNCKKKNDLTKSKEFGSIYAQLANNFKNKLTVFEECLQSLNDEISVLSTIFDENDRIEVHTDTFPIVIELNLKATHSESELYLSFYVPLMYPNYESLRIQCFLNAPQQFAGEFSYEMWLFLFKLNMLAQSKIGIGEQSLFEITEHCKEWLEEKDTQYKNNVINPALKLKNSDNANQDYEIQYETLRIALGTLDPNDCRHKHSNVGLRGIAMENNLEIGTVTDEDLFRTIRQTKKKTKYYWQWKNESGSMIKYPRHICKQIEALEVNDILSFHTKQDYFNILKKSSTRAIQSNVISGVNNDVIRVEIKLNHGNNYYRMKHLQKFSNKKKGCQEQMETEQYLKRNPRNKKQKREAAEMRAEAMANRAQLYKLKAKKRNNKRDHNGNINKGEMDHVANFEVIQFEQDGDEEKQIDFDNKNKNQKNDSDICVYNGWELNCTIQAIMVYACKEWKCSMSEAKAKLHQNLWNVSKIHSKSKKSKNDKDSKGNANGNGNENEKEKAVVHSVETQLELIREQVLQKKKLKRTDVIVDESTVDDDENNLFDLSKLDMDRGVSDGSLTGFGSSSLLDGIYLEFPWKMVENDDTDSISNCQFMNDTGYIYECPICLEERSIVNGIKLHCNHIMCLSCLSNYIFTHIESGNAFLKCPCYKCNLMIDEYIIHNMSDTILYKKYRTFLQNNFLETSDVIYKWCPNPNCGSVIKTTTKRSDKLKAMAKTNNNNNNNNNNGSNNSNSKPKSKSKIHQENAPPLVVCQCSLPLCLLCMRKFHWPLTCKQDVEWLTSAKKKKNQKIEDPDMPSLPEFEGVKINVNVDTKPCPKCGTEWEKNGGCNHIHCRKCFFHFCWVCGQEWSSNTHTSYYTCTKATKSFTKNTIEMEKPTTRYENELKRVLDERQKLRDKHALKLETKALLKKRFKKSIQHENASIFLIQKYLKYNYTNEKTKKRLKSIMKKIRNATVESGLSKWTLAKQSAKTPEYDYSQSVHSTNNKKAKQQSKHKNKNKYKNKNIKNSIKSPKSPSQGRKSVLLEAEKRKIEKMMDAKLTKHWMCNVIERMAQAHLVLSRAYRYLTYYMIDESEEIARIIDSLECVVFKLDKLFDNRNNYSNSNSMMDYEFVRYKYYDLGFYMEFFITETEYKLHPSKKQRILAHEEREALKKEIKDNSQYMTSYRTAFINNVTTREPFT